MPTYNTGNINQRMRVTGYGLYALSGLEVPRAGFIDFSYYDADPEYIEFDVPKNISYGPINFHFITGESISDPLYVSGVDFFPIPKIETITPSSQEVGEFVAISGSSLTGVSYVSFNNITGTNIFYNETSGGLMVKVPSGYTTGPVRISGYNGSGIVYSVSDINFFGKIFISGFSNNFPYEGDLLTISGRNFSTSFVNESYFPVYFTTSTDGITTGFVKANFTGAANNGDKISGIVPQNANQGYIVINSKDNTSFTSKSQINVLRTPEVFTSLNYYATSGDSNIVIGKNLNNVTDIILSGLNFRAPKTILNSGVVSNPTGKFNSAIYFSGGSYLVADSQSNQDFNIGAGDFTLEFFVKPSVIPSSRVDLINDAGLSNNGFFFYKAASSSNWVFNVNGSSIASIATSSTPINTWTKVSISRTNGNTHVFTKNDSSQTNTTNSSTSNSLNAGAGLYIGRLYTGLQSSLGVNSFEGYLDELRFSKVGRYTSSSLPDVNLQLNDDQNTILFLQCNFSDFDSKGDRNKLPQIPYISGYVEDSNYGAFNQSFTFGSLTKNSAGSTISYTNNVAPGIYDITLTNTGGRNFIFENFQIVKSGPSIKNISAVENYMGGQIDIVGHNLYPETQFVFQDTGNEFSLVEAPENAASYNYQSTYRPRKSITKNSVTLANSNSIYDGKTFGFSNASYSYLKFNITGVGTNHPMSYGNSFAFEVDFKPSSSLSSSDKRFIIGSKTGVNIYASANKVFVSGIRWQGVDSIFSGEFIESSWNHISISKSYFSSSSISGKVLLNGSGLNLSGDGVNYSTSNIDFTLNNDLSPISNFEVFVGSDADGSASSLWDGNIDEINLQKDDPYRYSSYQPKRRGRNNINTQILIHASVGLIDDNIRDFGYLQVNTPNLSSTRKTNIIIDNGFSSLTGGFDKRFTFLKTPNITGIYPSLLVQGQPVTGYGTDIYYVDTVKVGNYAATGFTIINSGSEFDQVIIFNLPDLAQSGEYLTLNSYHYTYTYPSGLPIKSGDLIIDGFSPTSGMAGSLINISGKFLNTVNSILLGSKNGNNKVINKFASQTISDLSFYIPNVYDIADGPITLVNSYTSVTSSGDLIFLNPSIDKIIPSSAYFTGQITLSGSNLSGLEFYGLGINNDLVKFPNISSVSGTGVVVSVPRDIKASAFRFFYSGMSGVTGEVAGYSRTFLPSTTISGVNSTGYYLKDPIIVTGINAHQLQSRDLYISGYNLLTNKTGQYLIAQNLYITDVSTLTGSGFYQPYTGYTILSGNLNVSVAAYSSFPDFNLIYSGTDPIGIGNDANYVDYGSLTLDGFIGSGKVFFQRNSFDPDEMYNLITIMPPIIKSSGINIATGSAFSLITLSGENLNYVTGIEFRGIGKLDVGASGGALAPVSVQVGYSTGISITIDAKDVNSNLIYKDFNTLKFYPPSLIGKNIHGKDVEDIRPVTGMFYLYTYLNNKTPVSGRFNYMPILTLKDGYLNNCLTYLGDGTSQISGYDGSIISFIGEGIRYLTGVDFYSESNNQIIEIFPTDFQIAKKKFDVVFLNQAGGPITGYRILNAGKGYTTLTSNITMASYGGQTPTATAYISRIPPYVGTVTGITLTTNVSSSPSDNYWSDSNLTILSPSSGFFIRNPSNLLFSGDNYATQSADGSKYYANYTASTTFPLNNDFVVGEKLNVKLYNYGSTYSTTDFPFLVTQNPNNFARITDIVLTGSYVGQKSFRINYSAFYSNSDSDFDLLDAQIKTSILYPTGYASKQIALTSFKPSKNGKFIDVQFSSTIPPTGDYMIENDPVDSKFLKFRIEAINADSSQFKGLGTISSKDRNLQGSVSLGSSSAGGGI